MGKQRPSKIECQGLAPLANEVRFRELWAYKSLSSVNRLTLRVMHKLASTPLAAATPVVFSTHVAHVVLSGRKEQVDAEKTQTISTETSVAGVEYEEWTPTPFSPVCL